MANITNTNYIDYTIPPGSVISGGGTQPPTVSGDFRVKVEYQADGTKTYSIDSVNIASTSGNDRFTNTYTDVGTFDAARTSPDHTGASISVDANGVVSVKFANPNARADANDYNELSFAFTDPAILTADALDDRASRTVELTGDLKETWTKDLGTTTSAVSTYSETETGTSGNDSITASASNYIDYTIPANSRIGSSTNGPTVSGDFRVKVEYNNDGTKTYSIDSANISSASSNSDQFVNTYRDVGTFDTARTGADHTGASISVDANGVVSVKFANMNATTTGPGNGNDYNELSFAFTDSAIVTASITDDGPSRTVELTGDLKETWTKDSNNATTSVTTYSETETGTSGNDSITADSNALLNTNYIDYTIPAGSLIGSSTNGPTVSGDFRVKVEYNNDGTKTYSIDSANISSASSNSDQFVNTYRDVGTFDTARTGADHTGASISVDANGVVSVKFSDPNTAYTSGSLTGDYNELSFSFTDPKILTADALDDKGPRTLEITGDLKETWTKDTNNATTSVSTYSETETGTSGNDSITAACYCGGTLIETSLGPIPVEDLSTTDLVLTVDGECKPIIWIGSSKIDCSQQEHKEKAYPICISKDALGENLPQRDLYVSPDHSLLIDGVMIPAYCLVNDITITQNRSENWVTYYHIELPKHEAIYAEGVPAESYLETSESNRQFFRNANGSQAASKVHELNLQYPVCPEDTPAWKHIWDTQGYAPLTQSGPILDAVKERLLARAQQLTKGLEIAA